MEGIKEVMVKEHAKIAILLEKLEADIANNQEARKDFQELRSYMKQHFYIEDDAIFSIFSNMNDKEVSSIFDLMQEHGLILGDLNDVEKAITKNLPVDLIKLKKDMKEHFEIEEKFFYPTEL